MAWEGGVSSVDQGEQEGGSVTARDGRYRESIAVPGKHLRQKFVILKLARQFRYNIVYDGHLFWGQAHHLLNF